MHPIRRQRLWLVGAGMLLLVLGLGSILLALQDNLNLFFTPSDVVSGKAQDNRTIRIGGLVAPGSVERSRGVEVRFAITDTANQVLVLYSGILPDLFQEDKGVVAVGRLDPSGQLVASEVLARHDENYMPPEAMEAIERAAKAQMTKQQS